MSAPKYCDDPDHCTYSDCPTAFCDRNGSTHSLQRPCSAATWKMLALRMADEALTCLNNSHWEVKFGSGDLLNTIRTVQRLQDQEAKMPPNFY